jgi:ABC-type bacteriocin/lantibiotic exporter with double-glycine peptidase domain
MVTAEVEPLGGFIGNAVAAPALHGGLLVTALVYISMQNAWMGLAALALFPVQGVVIPRLQRQVNALARERTLEVRRLSTRLGEAVDRLADLRAADQAADELSVLDARLDRILEIRYAIFKRKSFVKLLNSVLFQLTPFLFLFLGGYLVLSGELTIGALVAVLTAYKDIPPPARELFDYYQEQHDARLKYEQIVAQFMFPELDPAATPAGTGTGEGAPAAVLSVETASVAGPGGAALLEDVSFDLGAGEHVAVVGADSRTGVALARMLAGLVAADRGQVRVAASLALVEERPGFFQGSVGENLLFGVIAGRGGLAAGRIESVLCEVAARQGLAEDLARVSLEFRVGVAGAALDGRQRQGLGLARALVRDPAVLVMCRAESEFATAAQARLTEALREARRDRAWIMIAERPSVGRSFDRVLVFEGARVAEDGSWADLDHPGTRLRALLEGG